MDDDIQVIIIDELYQNMSMASAMKISVKFKTSMTNTVMAAVASAVILSYTSNPKLATTAYVLTRVVSYVY